MKIGFIRHGVTDWNRQGRIQGRTDISLCDLGRAELSRLLMPRSYAARQWLSSPLNRTLETAAILSGTPVERIPTEDRLMEMSWGDWEGERLRDLRKRFGIEMKANEDKGLLFRPPNGESPLDVRARVQEWLREVSRNSRNDVIAVTHKGVIRAVLSHATGWDMTGKPPHKLEWSALHDFSVSADGSLTVSRLNVPLDA